jgi:type III secretion protein N (ATPase)
MLRNSIDKRLTLGVQALDGLFTCGEGQRMGIFAAAGGGKSTLLRQITRNIEADINILAFVRERGRKVRELFENDLGPKGLKRSILVISTSDQFSMERLKAAYVARAIAEDYRDKGKKVLLMIDSVTRFAHAQHEIGLDAGESPTRRGFPPSVFATLPPLMEHARQSERGSITALYPSLVEADHRMESIADGTRSILDGHRILYRRLAGMNHYPALDLLASMSRLFTRIPDELHRKVAEKLRTIL